MAPSILLSVLPATPQLSTTKIYDRSQDRLTIAEIERVSFERIVAQFGND